MNIDSSNTLSASFPCPKRYRRRYGRVLNQNDDIGVSSMGDLDSDTEEEQVEPWKDALSALVNENLVGGLGGFTNTCASISIVSCIEFLKIFVSYLAGKASPPLHVGHENSPADSARFSVPGLYAGCNLTFNSIEERGKHCLCTTQTIQTILIASLFVV